MTNHEWCLKHDKLYREAWKEFIKDIYEKYTLENLIMQDPNFQAMVDRRRIAFIMQTKSPGE